MLLEGEPVLRCFKTRDQHRERTKFVFDRCKFCRCRLAVHQNTPCLVNEPSIGNPLSKPIGLIEPCPQRFRPYFEFGASRNPFGERLSHLGEDCGRVNVSLLRGGLIGAEFQTHYLCHFQMMVSVCCQPDTEDDGTSTLHDT